MKILYFYQYFTTPNGFYSTRVYEFTKIWQELGHDVTVVTSVYEKSDLRAKKFIETQVFNGVNVKVINIRIDNKQNFLKRIFTFIVYAFVSSYFALVTKADVVISSSGPITTGFPGVVAKIFRKKKFVFEVRDLWPDGAIELGLLKNRILIKVAYWFENMCYRKADLIVALSDGMKEFILQKYPNEKTCVVTNAADNSLFGVEAKNIDLPNFFLHKKIAIYSGNIGTVNNSELLLETASVLHELNRNDILILIIGDGQLKEKLQIEIEKRFLQNILVLEKIPKHILVKYVQSSLVSLVPLKDVSLLDTSSPNKLFDSFASGVPVIQTSNGWIKKLLDDHKCGITVSANEPLDFANALIYLAEHESEAKEMGLQGKNIAMNKFDKKILADKFLSEMNSVLSHK